mmetsp:Transcript_20909/g.32400  ORF Transcript_20909/g.32400 Transcript_20909/m.32400 type:complete len:296 (+) Transcript_20909:401-1288(+)
MRFELDVLLPDDFGIKEVLLLLIAVIFVAAYDNDEEEDHDSCSNNNRRNRVVDLSIDHRAFSFAGSVKVHGLLVNFGVRRVREGNVYIWSEHVDGAMALVSFSLGNHHGFKTGSSDHTVRDNGDIPDHSVENRGSEVKASSSESLCLSLLNLLEVFFASSFDLIVNDKGSLVHANYFDGGGMDAQGARQPVDELCCSAISKELFHRPLHSNHRLDGVSWLDLDFTASIQVELKDVSHSKIPVFSTESLLDGAIVLDGLVPLVHSDVFSVGLANLAGFSARVGDTNCYSHLPVQRS